MNVCRLMTYNIVRGGKRSVSPLTSARNWRRSIATAFRDFSAAVADGARALMIASRTVVSAAAGCDRN